MSEDHRTLHFGNPLHIRVSAEGATHGTAYVVHVAPDHPEGERCLAVLDLAAGEVLDPYGNRLSA